MSMSVDDSIALTGGNPALHGSDGHNEGELLFVLFYLYGFKVFGLENLAAVQALDVVDAVAPGDDLGAGMVAGGWHKQRFR